ncbi:MAG: zinc-binding dehydrogenase [Candidatus Coatesbacteria bacterium]
MAATMRAVVQFDLKPKSVELRDVPVPEPGEGEALLQVSAVAICGSDVHQYHATQSWKVAVPVILGHEFCGRVARIGRNAAGFAEGDRVVSETAAVIDETSPLTRQGKYNLDPARKGFGYGVDGAMASFVKVPVRCLHRIPGNVPDEIAAMAEPCCVAYQATVVNSPIKPGDVVAVLGPGPIGLLCAAIARLRGAGVVLLAGVTKDRARLAAGLTLGATHTVDVQTEDGKERLATLGDGLGADVVIDAAGVSAALRTALDWVRPGGHITKVGWGREPLACSLDPLVQKAVTLQGSFSHTWPVWESVLRLLSSGQLNPKPLLGRVAPLADWQSCFDGMSDGALIKAVLKP